MLWQANCTTLFQVSLDCLISFFCGLDFSFSTIGKLSNLCFLQSQLFGAILLWMPSLEQFCQKPCGFGKCSLFHWLFYLMPCQVLCHITKAIYFHIISYVSCPLTLSHITQNCIMSHNLKSCHVLCYFKMSWQVTVLTVLCHVKSKLLTCHQSHIPWYYFLMFHFISC